VGVLLRGYGRNITQPIVVRDDQNILVNAAKVGDEAMLLAKSLNKVCVIACAKRLLAAELAASPPYNCDVLILDDGFQHWQLGRDVDIMVLDSELPENGWRLFPLGYLREPLSALRRADVFVSDEKGKNELLQRFNKMSVRHLVSDNQVFCTNREIKGLSNILSKVTLSRDDLVRIDWPVFWFAGIARPERIEASLNELGANKKRRMGLPLEDHYEYTRDNLEDIFQQYAKWRETLTEEQQANGRLVCTEKDAVKIELLLKRNDPQIEYIVMDVSIAEMDRFLNTVLPNKDK
jgi:tetraacyldisaccharide 4'-kinase